MAEVETVREDTADASDDVFFVSVSYRGTAYEVPALQWQLACGIRCNLPLHWASSILYNDKTCTMIMVQTARAARVTGLKAQKLPLFLNSFCGAKVQSDDQLASIFDFVQEALDFPRETPGHNLHVQSCSDCSWFRSHACDHLSLRGLEDRGYQSCASATGTQDSTSPY